MKDFHYKNDVILGTWVAIALFLGTMLGTLLHFEQLTTRPVVERECDVCLWTNP